ncbi:diguanylate cyclase [Thiomicrorhabdus sp. 6S2-11]|uniref:Diguanylate cyclase n=1 Tax=Thiomicrorhabdus marina TaxID=2818442 RepID=A0ABS3Q7A0_9GAMM|nr:diguanylate cyclase [Thiomicrorhabdus marina]
MNLNSGEKQQRIFTLKNLYFLVLLSLAAWALLGYATMTAGIKNNEGYAELINLSGKQRMLSQRTALLTARVYANKDFDLAAEREQLIKLMREDFQYIQEHLPSEYMKSLYFDQPTAISVQVQDYLTLLESAPGEHYAEYVEKVFAFSSKLLPSLDYAVSEFQKESESRTAELKTRESFILLGTLLTLLIEAMFIILPVFQRMAMRENKFETLFNLIPFPIAYVNKDGQLYRRNQEFVKQTGYDQKLVPDTETWLHKVCLSSACREEIAARWKAHLEQAPHNHDIIKSDLYEIRFQDGSVHQVMVGGRIYEQGYIVTLFDVTEEVALKSELEKTSNQLKQAQSIAQLGSWTFDFKNNQLNWSDEIYRIFGIDSKQFLPTYDSFLKVIHPDDVDKVNQSFDRSVKDKTPYRIEHRLLMDDGRIKYVLEHGRTNYDEDGNPQLAIGAVLDITEQKKLQLKLDKEREKYKSILSLSSDGLFIMNPFDGRLIEHSEMVGKLLGYTNHELKDLDVLDWDKGVQTIEDFQELTKHIDFEPVHFERFHTRKDGTSYLASITAVKITIDGEAFLSASVRDITDQKANEILIQKQNQELDIALKRNVKALDIINDYVMTSTSDLQGRFTHVSQALCKLSGYSREELIGQRHSIFKSGEMSELFYRELWSTISNGKIWNGEIKNRAKDGQYFWLDTRIIPEFKDGKLVEYQAVAHDITYQKLMQVRSEHDPLTSIYNRNKLNDFLLQEMLRIKRYENRFSMILIDIDHFKSVNDDYGHNVGDKVLVSFAEILKNTVRESDIAGRWGGEEFIVFCTETKLEDAVVLAEKLRAKIAEYEFDVIGKKTASFGVAEYRATDDAESFINRADAALYQAKENGRNRVVAQRK